jgi:hypothetical protein
VNTLESPVLLSQFQRVSFLDGTSVEFPIFRNLPRTGGVAVQTGTILGVGVAQPTTNVAHVTDEDPEEFTAEWNGRPSKSFTGVTATIVQAESATNDQITFNLKGPRPSPAAVAVGSVVPTDAAPASKQGDPVIVDLTLPKPKRTGGFAVQSGSLLTITVNGTTTNIVEISNCLGGIVEAEWNGRGIHTFRGVQTIVVDTHNARNDLVAIDNASH